MNYFLMGVFLFAISQTALGSKLPVTQDIVLSKPDQQRQQALIYMVRQDCGSCHGMTLKGGLGPSLLPERLSVLPDQYLIDAISDGRQGTPMPPWKSILSKYEIQWIVQQLKAGLEKKPQASEQALPNARNEKSYIR